MNQSQFSFPSDSGHPDHRPLGATPSLVPQALSKNAGSAVALWTSYPMEAFENWMNQAQGGRGFKERSKTVYRSMWRKLVKHAGGRCAFLGAAELTHFLGTVHVRGSQAVSLTQQRRYLVLLCNVQDSLLRMGAIEGNAARALLEQKPMQEAALRRALPVALSQDQEVQVKEAMHRMADERPTPWRAKRDAAVIAALLGSGLKVHELQSVRLRDLDKEANGSWSIRVTTNGLRERRCPVASGFDGRLADWSNWLRTQGATDASPLFLSSNDDSGAGVDPELELDLSIDMPWGTIKPISSTQVWRIVNGVMVGCGVQGRLARQGPTVLRNTFATRQIRMGVPIERLALWLGHKDPNSTKVYESLVQADLPA
jgi:integrase/recombinase XerD